ncbi:competence/damage-inducible protein A [Candidatus Contubernalis alkaliaceticus]|uniref:competence/damage-inducible protein A n=1 Tax=Candidatus Contubernalis alkaliaceticus TaxID=338645 RepID=UPI001F4C00CF|nr:competence/damage-inducible protein A [Candidatus Contubernalis alkalaceticus]UNC91867.1 competence/damage-inducible protein A [Candidatus Contubernalis alkalaceticus]
MRAEIINVGNEVLLGYVLNENACFLSMRLASLGIELMYHTVVGDQSGNIGEAFAQAKKRAEMIIFTGGLGTTVDDLTKEVVCNEIGLPLVKSAQWEEHLEKLYSKVGTELDEKRRRQAYVPKGSILIPNENGTAPGIIIDRQDMMIILLPGPPEELKPMVDQTVMPYLQLNVPVGIIKTRVLRVMGLGEATLEDSLSRLIDGEGNPRVVLMAQSTEVHIYITGKGNDQARVEKMIQEKENIIKEELGSYLYGTDEETLEQVVSQILLDGGYTVAAAESCSGGLLADKFTNIPGSSNYFLRGIVSYNNEAKVEILKVPRETLDTVGAVSEETARIMAENIRSFASADFGLSITGYAGPSQGSLDPVGLVYIGLSTNKGTFCQRCNFWGGRRSIKEQSAVYALNMLRLYLLGFLDSED